MVQKSSNVTRTRSQINYSYATIKMTQSRIDKGLIAIPVRLKDLFPDHNDTIQIYLNDSPVSETKQYSSYLSSTRECRIGGVKQWFQQNNLKSGDEIVIQVIDRENFVYRLIPERTFILETEELQRKFDHSETEQDASEKIEALTHWTHSKINEAVFNEYYRLINILPSKDRKNIEKSSSRARESVPASLRTLLRYIFNGHCQVCDFWFFKRNGEPYFEIHHLDPLKGHQLKNLLVVCGNCHNQFEHADVKHIFNDDEWLVRVSFNERTYPVKQAVLNKDFYKDLFI